MAVADRGSECSLTKEAPTVTVQAADHVSPVSLPYSNLKHYLGSNLKVFQITNNNYDANLACDLGSFPVKCILY